jgi:pyruvate dehydrogenase E1 component beta subunit
MAVGGMLGKTIDASALTAARHYPHDVPGDWFTGPF